MARKYPGHSPFNYCEGSPINRIDPQGDTIVVLYARSGAYGFGHMAILVQDKDGVYHLFSKNGETDKMDPETRERHKNDIDVVISDVQAFLNNQDSNKDNQKNKSSGSSSSSYYTSGYMIATTPKQDAIIAETITKEINNDYRVFKSNCSQAVKNSLKAAGVPTSTLVLEALPILFSSNGSALGSIEKFLNKTVPARMYFNIRKANPGGKMYRPNR